MTPDEATVLAQNFLLGFGTCMIPIVFIVAILASRRVTETFCQSPACATGACHAGEDSQCEAYE